MPHARPSRSRELRARHRRVLFWSFGVAALLHVAVLVIRPTYQVEPFVGSGLEMVPGDSTGMPGTPVTLFFGPPEIRGLEGVIHVEPVDRILEVPRAVDLSPACIADAGRRTASGRVRLSVGVLGYTDVVALEEGTGIPCWDSVLRAVAADLWYRWLPSERFPAPVDVIQPVTVSLAL